jgi:hypothetical protein
VELHPRADLREASDDDARADVGRLVDARRSVDDRRRVDGRLARGLRVEQAECARVGEVGIARAQDGDLTARLRTFGEVDGRGARRTHARRVARVGEEGDVAGLGLVEPGRAGDLDVGGRFGLDARPGLFGEFCEFHKKL